MTPTLDVNALCRLTTSRERFAVLEIHFAKSRINQSGGSDQTSKLGELWAQLIRQPVVSFGNRYGRTPYDRISDQLSHHIDISRFLLTQRPARVGRIRN